jgi:hypothetical protein
MFVIQPPPTVQQFGVVLGQTPAKDEASRRLLPLHYQLPETAAARSCCLRVRSWDQVVAIGLSVLERGSLFVWLFLLLDRHILQFTGLENVPTFLAFHIFEFFVAGDDLDLRMLALLAADFPL